MATYNSHMFYLGNFADMDTDESDSDSELDNLIVGSYSKPPLTSVTVEDFNNDEVLWDDESAGTAPDFANEYVEYDVGSGLTQQYIDSTIVVDVAVLLGDGSTINIQGTVIQLQNGDVFITDYANGGSMDNLAVQSLTLSNPDSFFTGFFANSSVDNSSTVCFAPETLIETSDGPRPVSRLRVGDMVQTLDAGLQPIRWIACKHNPTPGKHAPIEVAAHSLAPGVPERPLRVSPQHRILIASPISQRMFGTREVFVAAKALLDLPGVTQNTGNTPVTYWHFACDDHQLVVANGAWVETFYPGPMALDALTPDQREEVLELLGPLLEDPALSRKAPPMRQQKQLVRRLSQNRIRRRAFEGTPFNATQPSGWV